MKFQSIVSFNCLAGFFFMIITGFVWSGRVTAATVGGVHFESGLTHRGIALQLKGTAKLTYLRVIDAYVGALYLPAEMDAVNALDDTPKRLVLEYFRSIEAHQFQEATTKLVRRNTDSATFRRLEPRLQELNGLYRNVVPKDRYALTYVPEIGTELSLNGETLGLVTGSDFAKALFSMWIGQDPIDTEFKNTLLGLRQD